MQSHPSAFMSRTGPHPTAGGPDHSLILADPTYLKRTFPDMAYFKSCRIVENTLNGEGEVSVSRDEFRKSEPGSNFTIRLVVGYGAADDRSLPEPSRRVVRILVRRTGCVPDCKLTYSVHSLTPPDRSFLSGRPSVPPVCMSWLPGLTLTDSASFA